jgi:quercetin dioxygenase-like cupin family protein
MEQGDILAMGPNITHKYTGTDDTRVALVCTMDHKGH